MKLHLLHVRRTAPLLAQLAVFAILFQVIAIDHHWHPDVNSVRGVEGSSAHQMHCHGAGDCANGGGGGMSATTIVTPVSLPLPSENFAFKYQVEDEQADSTAVAPDLNPPRAISSL